MLRLRVLEVDVSRLLVGMSWVVRWHSKGAAGGCGWAARCSLRVVGAAPVELVNVELAAGRNYS